MTDEPTPFVKFEVSIDPRQVSTLGVRVRLRWWVAPSMWLANHLLHAVVKHGVKITPPRPPSSLAKLFSRKPKT